MLSFNTMQRLADAKKGYLHLAPNYTNLKRSVESSYCSRLSYFSPYITRCKFPQHMLDVKICTRSDKRSSDGRQSTSLDKTNSKSDRTLHSCLAIIVSGELLHYKHLRWVFLEVLLDKFTNTKTNLHSSQGWYDSSKGRGDCGDQLSPSFFQSQRTTAAAAVARGTTAVPREAGEHPVPLNTLFVISCARIIEFNC